MPDVSNEKVVLLHGLGRTPRIFNKMAKKLQSDHYDVLNIGYPSQRFGIAVLTRDYLAPTLLSAELTQAKKVHFVGHSLGGILIRSFLKEYQLKNLGRIVMLAAPNHGSEVAEWLKPRWFYRWIMGPAGQELGVGKESVPKKLGSLQAEFGVIAGTRSLNPLFSHFLPGINDGKVSLQSAKLEGMQDFLAVPCSHAWITQNNEVIRQVEYFIANGKFDHGPTSQVA